jgi:hypothetical protein
MDTFSLAEHEENLRAFFMRLRSRDIVKPLSVALQIVSGIGVVVSFSVAALMKSGRFVALERAIDGPATHVASIAFLLAVAGAAARLVASNVRVWEGVKHFPVAATAVGLGFAMVLDSAGSCGIAPNLVVGVICPLLGLHLYAGRQGLFCSAISMVSLAVLATADLFDGIEPARSATECVPVTKPLWTLVITVVMVLCFLLASTTAMYRFAGILLSGSRIEHIVSVGAAGVGALLVSQWLGLAIREFFGVDLRKWVEVIGYGALASLLVEGWSRGTLQEVKPESALDTPLVPTASVPLDAKAPTLFDVVRLAVEVFERWISRSRFRNS